MKQEALIFISQSSSHDLEENEVLAINNAAINRDIEKDKILTVWSKPLYNYVDFGFRVTPRCDSICVFTSNSHIINHKENIGRRI